MRRFQKILCFLGAFGLAAPAHASYTLATSSCAINTGGWCLEGANMTGFLAGILNANNFGPTGTVTNSVTLSSLDTVNASTLSGANGFISTWWEDSEASSSVANILAFFNAGGDLIIFQDDTQHDSIGEALGFPTIQSDGSVSNGSGPLLNGPFGAATNIIQLFNTGALSLAQITALNGNVGSLNANGEATSAYWGEGQFAPGTGKLIIVGDVDMVSIYGASFDPINDNGRFGLNSIAYLIEGEVGAVPEPSTWLMLVGGFGAVGGVMRRRRTVRHAQIA